MDIKKIGRFIAYNRKQKGLTQEQLGEKLGVTNKTVSRWENGNYMPDLSLLEPLSRELGITLNELLSGETIEQENIVRNTEKNLIRTIDYTAQKINNEHKKISIVMMGLGIILSISALTICGAESSWSSIYSIIGIIIFVFGVFRELKIKSLWKKLLAASGIFVLILSVFLAIDSIGVMARKRPPIYRYMTKTTMTETLKIIVYYNPFYNVYRINADTENEYYIVDVKNQYTLKTVPLSPFNRDNSGIDNIIKYADDYVGNNSNTGNLIGNLPLSEHGYVFEIDTEKEGLVIDYHMTDWYENDDLYVEKSLIYNSVSIFALIQNVQYIQYNFSGNSYTMTRNVIEENYPAYKEILNDGTINKDNFNKYVEAKMYDNTFIESFFSYF